MTRSNAAQTLKSFSFPELDLAELERLLELTDISAVASGATLIREGDVERDLYLLLEGEVAVVRHGVELSPLAPGVPMGVLGLLTGRPRAASLLARSELVVARLPFERWSRLSAAEPAFALKVANALFAQVREELMGVTDHVGMLLEGRSLPRRPEVEVQVLGEKRRVRSGTTLRQLIPEEVGGALVVAGLLGRKPVSLNTAVLHEGQVEALTMAHWEGRKVFANSLGLLLLEAANRLRPGLVVRLGPSLGAAQLVEVDDASVDLSDFAPKLQAAMEHLAAEAAPIRQEHWAVEEAHAWLDGRGWHSAARMLRTHRQASVPLCSLGDVYALSVGPLLPNTKSLTGFEVKAGQRGLLLHYGTRDPRFRRGADVPEVRGRDMPSEHRHWLKGMGIASVGDFNEMCVEGRVAQVIRAAEGYHEKSIGQLADDIARRRDSVRIIAVAGPSSSGKTTFLKRLTVQLHINGLTPRGLSLDDYYVDREKSPRDAHGDYDFEAIEALDLDALQSDVRKLLAGEPVRPPKYDFKAGKSLKDGGHELQLMKGDVLVLEGIHGLNPRLLGGIPKGGELYRIFIHPATALAFDRLTRVSPSDLRLIRRIVRDRHSRGYKAADNIMRWPSVQAGEQAYIFPWLPEADAVFDTALAYEPAVLKVYAERYLLEVPAEHPAYPTAWRLRHLVDRFVAVYPDHVPPTSILREFIGGSGFEY